MKQNHHFVVQKDKFILESHPELSSDSAVEKLISESILGEYRYGTKQARHLFCKECGVQAFYQPRSNADCWAITLYCIPNYETTFEEITYKTFDGQNWE